MTIDSKTFLGMIDNVREVVGLLCNYGLLFFTSRDFNLVDFFPIVGSKITQSQTENATHLTLTYSDQTEKMIIFSSTHLKELWFKKLSRAMVNEESKPADTTMN